MIVYYARPNRLEGSNYVSKYIALGSDMNSSKPLKWSIGLCFVCYDAVFLRRVSRGLVLSKPA